MTKFSPTPTVNFPADVPWVTAVGGTTLLHTNNGYTESAWTGSGGGRSAFFAEPDFQKGMPSAVQSLLAGHRGIPDVASDSNPDTVMVDYINKLAASQNTQRDFRDITSGSNRVDGANIHLEGFSAMPGWDAVTGWGTPQASQFVPDLIAAMQ